MAVVLPEANEGPSLTADIDPWNSESLAAGAGEGGGDCMMSKFLSSRVASSSNLSSSASDSEGTRLYRPEYLARSLDILVYWYQYI